MARRRRSNRLVVPEAEEGLRIFKAQVMRRQGYVINPDRPDDVKYAVAKKMGVPLKPGYNGDISTESAGKIGGEIGGTMVREMVRIAKEQLIRQQQR